MAEKRKLKKSGTPARQRRAALGQAKLALRFQIPSQASLQMVFQKLRSMRFASGPATAPVPPRSDGEALIAAGLK
jgi:hypothetical protein